MDGQDMTRCSACNAAEFDCSVNRNFYCSNCGAPVVIHVASQIDRMETLTIHLGENEPIIGPAITERMNREED